MANPVQRWEYTTLYVQRYDYTLDRLGAMGWELVCIDPNGHLIFKRPLPIKAVDEAVSD